MRHWPAPILQSTEADILHAAQYANRLRCGSHPENGNYMADIFDCLVSVINAENPEDAAYAAEDLVDAATRLRDEKDGELS